MAISMATAAATTSISAPRPIPAVWPCMSGSIRPTVARDIHVTSLDADVDSPLDLHVVQAGTYAADCGNFASDCGAGVKADHDSLILGLDSGSSVLMHWQNDHFETDFVRNDEAQDGARAFRHVCGQSVTRYSKSFALPDQVIASIFALELLLFIDMMTAEQRRKTGDLPCRIDPRS
ncbi:MAG: hypothetical protein WDN06_08500 [Asticcacaulis sp.]